jgi:AcrR family transcriptional regulator
MEQTPDQDNKQEQGKQRRPGGRSARVRALVLDATLALLADDATGFTIPRVAARAGVHETSIYRRWGTREALIMDAVSTRINAEIPVPDTGSLRGDLLASLGSSAALLTSPLGRQFLRAAAVAPDSTSELRQAYWPGRFERAAIIFERAIARGEIAALVDATLASELLIAPLYFRLLVSHAPIDDALIERLIDLLLRGIPAATAGTQTETGERQ